MKYLKPLVAATVLLLVLTSGYYIYQRNLSEHTNDWFSASGNCEMCHGTSDIASRDAQGNDISPVTHWRSTMLANSSNDPFWRAKVKHEGLSNPEHKEALENVCTRCHAPMGMLNALLNQAAEYNFTILQTDEMGQDGISCTLCHQINGFSAGEFSGVFNINTSGEIYGPYTSPITNQMYNNTGFTPVHNPIINESRLCGSCHTLITNSVDETGKPTGSTFVEQALYHEWENSAYAEQNTSCQSCHMPRLDESVKISSRPGFAPYRQPFGVHSFTGGNAFMLQLLNDNHDELNLAAGTDNLEASILRTKDLLTQNTIDLNLHESQRTTDTLFIEVQLKNKAGHKFPTGFPSRRAYIEFLVLNSNDTLFHSGAPGSDALFNNTEAHFEPHHQTINSEKQAQIYEFVMGDTDGELTTVLERAYEPLKDNRIPPLGFSQAHANYDTVKVVGHAAFDADYEEGLGTEKVIYAIPRSQLTGSVKFVAKLHYETVPESWVQDLFNHAEDDEDIGRFKSMYEQMENKALIVASDSVEMLFTGIENYKNNSISIFPNPSSGIINLHGIDKTFRFAVYSQNGSYIKSGTVNSAIKELDLQLPPGSYLFLLESEDEQVVNKLIIQT